MAIQFLADEAVRPKPPETPEPMRKVIRCGDRPGGHKVRVHRAAWPPRGPVHPHSFERPTVTTVCLDCQATLLLTDPPGHRVTVQLYGPVSARQGAVLEAPEPGAVLDEGDEVVEAPPPAATPEAGRPSPVRRRPRGTARRRGRLRGRRAAPAGDASPQEGGGTPP
jgi:hypothetical protein